MAAKITEAKVKGAENYVLMKAKGKKMQDKAVSEHQEWCKLALFCQGVNHLNREEADNQCEKSGALPPYTKLVLASAPPLSHTDSNNEAVKGLYPTINVSKGTILVTEGPPAQRAQSGVGERDQAGVSHMGDRYSKAEQAKPGQAKESSNNSAYGHIIRTVSGVDKGRSGNQLQQGGQNSEKQTEIVAVIEGHWIDPREEKQGFSESRSRAGRVAGEAEGE